MKDVTTEGLPAIDACVVAASNQLREARLEVVPRELTEALTRALVHYYNTEDKVSRFAATVAVF